MRTNAPPLPGLTCWNSTTVHSWPSMLSTRPFLRSFVVATTGQSTGARSRRVGAVPRPVEVGRGCGREERAGDHDDGERQRTDRRDVLNVDGQQRDHVEQTGDRHHRRVVAVARHRLPPVVHHRCLVSLGWHFVASRPGRETVRCGAAAIQIGAGEHQQRAEHDAGDRGAGAEQLERRGEQHEGQRPADQRAGQPRGQLGADERARDRARPAAPRSPTSGSRRTGCARAPPRRPAARPAPGRCRRARWRAASGTATSAR